MINDTSLWLYLFKDAQIYRTIHNIQIYLNQAHTLWKLMCEEKEIQHPQEHKD